MNMLRRVLTFVCAALVSFNVATAGAEQTPQLTETEMAALLNQVARCWSVPTEAANGERVSVKVQLEPSGALKGDPTIVSDAPDSRLAQSAIRAVKRCSPFSLPAEKYGAWAEITINFDPSEMK